MQKIRCPWCESSPRMITYHDTEWGTPVHDDRLHFEFLCLEALQAGLSWAVVLNKRENLHAAFHGFDPQRVAAIQTEEIDRMLTNPGIIRNRAKLQAIVHNANLFLELQARHGTFNHYFWSFSNGSPINNQWTDQSQIPPTSPLSDIISREFKQTGFKFLGSTTIYAHIQAVGMVNDHLLSCFRYPEILSIQAE